jgi:membrane protease YdiL (CAAX protease family)
MSPERTRWTWRSGALVGTFAPIFGLAALIALTGTGDAETSTAGRIGAGVAAVVLAAIAGRTLIVGLHVDERRARVRGLFATRSVPREHLAGVVVEGSVRDRWRSPSVVSTDGRVIRARWASGRTKGGHAAEVGSGSTAVLHALGIGPERLTEAMAVHGIAAVGVAAQVNAWRSPPTWPAPPPGWSPPPGWQPPPEFPPPPADWQYWTQVSVPVVIDREYAPESVPAAAQAPERFDQRYRLDRAVAFSLPTSNWGMGEAIQAFGWLALLIGVVAPIGIFVSGRLGDLLSESSIGFAVVLAARKAAGQSGGWRRALGWDLPRWRDVGLGLRWYGWQLMAGISAALILWLVTIPLGGHRASNVDISRHDSVITIVTTILVAVFVAPVVEEFFFRGLLLRTAFRRFSFWPSAVATSLIFGSAHTPQVDGVRARILLGGVVGTFGLVQCVLVRRKGRLGPNMIVHGLFNAVAVASALL